MDIDTKAIRRLRDTLLLCDDLRDFTADNPARPGNEDRERALIRRVEPFAETMYLVMMADGEPADVERKALSGALHVLTDGNISNPQMEALLDRCEANVRREGSEARLAQIGTRIGGDRDDRETAFTLAAVVALADQRFDLRENRVLEWVKEYFGVADHRADALLATID
jgi:tellurite resistance protein